MVSLCIPFRILRTQIDTPCLEHFHSWPWFWQEPHSFSKTYFVDTNSIIMPVPAPQSIFSTTGRPDSCKKCETWLAGPYSVCPLRGMGNGHEAKPQTEAPSCPHWWKKEIYINHVAMCLQGLCCFVHSEIVPNAMLIRKAFFFFKLLNKFNKKHLK